MIYYTIISLPPNKNPPPYNMTSLPPSKLIVCPSKVIVTIFASEGGVFYEGEIVPPSKLMVNKKSPQRGGFLLAGVSF